MPRVYIIVFIMLLSAVNSKSMAWLGERITGEFEGASITAYDRLEQAEFDFNQTDKHEQIITGYKPWIATEEIQKQQKNYRDKLQQRWPNAQGSVRASGLTYYPDNFNASVSVQFSTNQIEIIVPREYKRAYLYDQLAERKKVGQYLEQLLGMRRSELLKLLESELMLDPNRIKPEDDSDALVFQELFKGQPSQSEIIRLAHTILQTARILGDDKAMKAIFKKEERVKFVMNMPSTRLEAAAQKYKTIIAEYSAEFDVPESLILAVIHTESHFNPLARSSIPAFGLMQIVPATAGKDAATMLFEQPPELSPDFLFQERNNIRLGAAYLSILYYRYLKSIKNERSRAYVAIAAYNTGPSNIARAFVNVPKMSEAIPVINAMSDKDVLDRMLNYAPSKETRQYLSKIVAREKYYKRAITYW